MKTLIALLITLSSVTALAEPLFICKYSRPGHYDTQLTQTFGSGNFVKYEDDYGMAYVEAEGWGPEILIRMYEYEGNVKLIKTDVRINEVVTVTGVNTISCRRTN